MSNTPPNLSEDDAKIVEWLSNEYPQISEEFRSIMLEQFVLFAKKHKGYGCDNITLGSSLSTPEDIKLSLTGVIIRMMDKINRLKSIVLQNGEDLVGEALEDTLRDHSVYAIIAQIVQKGKFKK